jgi:glycosyltransferase involved in cell wall biosynthesis
MAQSPATSGGRPLTVVVPKPPTYRGGTEEYAYQLVKEYSAHRSVRVVTTTATEGTGKESLSIGTATLESLHAREMLDRPVVQGSAAWSQLRRAVESSSAVQLHMPFPRVERKVAGWARAAHVPLVLTYHMDAEFGTNPDGLFPRMVTWAYRRFSSLPALSDSSVIVSNSLGYAKASPVLSRYLPKVRVIYQGIDLERLRSNGSGPSAAVPPRTPGVARIVFIGRVVPYKGLPDLLEATARLLTGGRRLELLLGGRGPQLEDLQARAGTLGISGSVRFLGFVPDDAVGDLYRSADVVACPSISLLESTPITLQEAMAFGVPVVGTTLPGTEETVPNDGVRGRLVDPHDVDGLARALGEILDSGHGRVPATSRTWADTAGDYLKLFDELERAGGAA